jgi:hypothetical protein
MTWTGSTLLLVVAVVLFVWAALVAVGWVTFGTYGALLAFGLAAFAASFLPWRTP